MTKYAKLAKKGDFNLEDFKTIGRGIQFPNLKLTKFKLFNPVFIPHINIHSNEVNPQFGLTFNFIEELLGHCLGMNIYFNKKIIHLGIKF